jgi:hypothetical protein
MSLHTERNIVFSITSNISRMVSYQARMGLSIQPKGGNDSAYYLFITFHLFIQRMIFYFTFTVYYVRRCTIVIRVSILFLATYYCYFDVVRTD